MSQEAELLKTGMHLEKVFSWALGTHSLSLGAGCPGKRSALLLQGRIRGQRQKVSNGRQAEPRAIPPPNWKKEQGSEGFLTKKETERRKRARSLKNSDMKRHLDSKMPGNPQTTGQVFPGKAWLQGAVGRREGKTGHFTLFPLSGPCSYKTQRSCPSWLPL